MKVESNTLALFLGMLESTGGKLQLSLFQKSDEFTWSKRGEFPVSDKFIEELRKAAKP